MDDNLPDLGDLERDVMQLVWAEGQITAETVRERLARKLKESTVRTVLRRLEEKGYVSHTVDGRTYVYQAKEERGRVAAKAVQRIVDDKKDHVARLLKLLQKLDVKQREKIEHA